MISQGPFDGPLFALLPLRYRGKPRNRVGGVVAEVDLGLGGQETVDRVKAEYVFWLSGLFLPNNFHYLFANITVILFVF